MDAHQLIEAGRRFANLHSSHGAPPKSIYLVGHQPSNLHDEFLGEYVLEGYHLEKPVYGLKEWRCREYRQKPDAVMYVLNRSAGQAWTIGKRASMGSSHLEQLAVFDDAATPSEITGVWGVYAVEEGWVAAPALQVLTGKEGAAAAAAHERWIQAKADASPKRVRLQGALPDAGVGIGLGEYVRVPGGLCDRRPLYESVDRCFRGKCHLRYVAAQGSWFIGDESHLGDALSSRQTGYLHVPNAMAWNPACISVKSRRRFGEKLASTIGVWMTLSRTPDGGWFEAPGLELVDVDAEIDYWKEKRQALTTMLCILSVALIPAALHLGRQMLIKWREARKAAARAQKVQDRRRQRRAVEMEVSRFAKSLGRQTQPTSASTQYPSQNMTKPKRGPAVCSRRDDDGSTPRRDVKQEPREHGWSKPVSTLGDAAPARCICSSRSSPLSSLAASFHVTFFSRQCTRVGG